MRAAHASVLRETDTAVRGKSAGFDLADCRFDETAAFSPLLVRNDGLQVLNLRTALSNEDDQSSLLNPADPGIADHLRIKRHEALGLFGIATRRSFPVDQTLRTVEFRNGVEIGHEFIST